MPKYFMVCGTGIHTLNLTEQEYALYCIEERLLNEKWHIIQLSREQFENARQLKGKENQNGNRMD